VYGGGGGIGVNRGSWEGWLDGGLLKGCGAERRWSIVEQERDKGWADAEGIRFYWREWVGFSEEKKHPQDRSGHEFSINFCIILFHDSTSVSRCELDEEAKRDRIGGGGLGIGHSCEAWGARGKMRDPCCWSPCHDVTFPANLPGKDLDPI
jgi:hypothetical protein